VLAHVLDEGRVDDRAVLRDLGADPVQALLDDLLAACGERVDQARERVGRNGLQGPIIRRIEHRAHAAISRAWAMSAGITIARLSSLPLALCGRPGANHTRRGYLDSATRSRT
jgi:hypothetical protein